MELLGDLRLHSNLSFKCLDRWYAWIFPALLAGDEVDFNFQRNKTL